MPTASSKIIQNALADSRHTLSEFESKTVLAEYKLPVADQALAGTAREACDAADQIGYPVAMKACGPRLLHKTESGGVALNISSHTEVRQTFETLMSINPRPEGILVQAMVAGGRELVVGCNRDPQFGPCVMLGLGGIFTEVLADTAFRAMPFDRVEALDMAAELRHTRIFKEFRGEAPVDLDRLADILLAVRDLAMSHPQIDELDINPLIITRGGECVAVDALVVLQKGLQADGV